jgi:hypothetical protein
MPKVRASSGTIGTTLDPNRLSRHRLRSRRVKAVVVDAACLPDPASTSANAFSSGGSIGRRAVVVRRGSEPSRACRRWSRYRLASLSSASEM